MIKEEKPEPHQGYIKLEKYGGPPVYVSVFKANFFEEWLLRCADGDNEENDDDANELDDDEEDDDDDDDDVKDHEDGVAT